MALLMKGSSSWYQFVNRTKCKLVFSTCKYYRFSSSSIFDSNAKRLQRNRAALLGPKNVYSYLKDEVAAKTVDRVCDISRFFNKALDFGSGLGHISKQLNRDIVGDIYQADFSELMIENADICPNPEVTTHSSVVSNESLTFADDSFDLVISSLYLHWINDLPKCLSEIRRVMRKDGVLVGCVFTKDTLFELRSSLQIAEMERQGGVSSHVSPFIEVQDIGSLLANAGFTMVTIDVDEIVIEYPSIFELMSDLKGMGESSADQRRQNFLRRDTLFAAAATYQELYGNGKGDISATFQLLFFIGWKPQGIKNK